LEERTKELEDRNRLLIKARNAIETLQGDLEVARAHSKLIRTNEHQETQKHEQANDMLRDQIRTIEFEYQTSLKQYTDQIKVLQDKLMTHEYRTDIHLGDNEKLKETNARLSQELASYRSTDIQVRPKLLEDLTSKLKETQQYLEDRSRVKSCYHKVNSK
jgi:ribosome recycling factor